MTRKNPETVWFLGFPNRYLFRFAMLVAGVGFEPHDLRVMSPTSYQAALSRDIYRIENKKENGAGHRARTGTGCESHGILSPGRLPIPPLRQT